jgi:hypothetical protein
MQGFDWLKKCQFLGQNNHQNSNWLPLITTTENWHSLVSLLAPIIASPLELGNKIWFALDGSVAAPWNPHANNKCQQGGWPAHSTVANCFSANRKGLRHAYWRPPYIAGGVHAWRRQAEIVRYTWLMSKRPVKCFLHIRFTLFALDQNIDWCLATLKEQTPTFTEIATHPYQSQSFHCYLFKVENVSNKIVESLDQSHSSLHFQTNRERRAILGTTIDAFVTVLMLWICATCT